MPVSPLVDAEGPVRVVVTSGGTALMESAALISLTVRRSVNQVPSARLLFSDGDVALGMFPLSDSPQLEPGAKITVRAGYGTDDGLIFSGIVVSHGILIDGANGARLVVECRDEAVRMTVGCRTRRYLDQTDADILQALASEHGLVVRISDTRLNHAQLVQADCTDWDFLLARAAANGCVVVATDGRLAVMRPSVDGAADLVVACGESLIDFSAQLRREAPDTGPPRACGRMRFQGSARAAVGSPIGLEGIGQRFSGTVFTTGLTHSIEDGTWTTEVDFEAPASSRARPGAAASVDTDADGATGIDGLHVGLVLRLDADPAGEHRVQVKLPAAGVDSLWARVMQFQASNNFGAFFVPEVGDEVLIGFLANDPASPVVLGSLYSRSRPPAHALTAGNNIRSIVTGCNARLVFDDEERIITVTTPAGNTVVLSDKDRSVVLVDQTGNRVALEPAGITLQSLHDIRIDAKGSVQISAVGALTLDSKADARLAGLNVACEARVGLTAKGSATAELSAGGQTTVKGALVMIN